MHVPLLQGNGRIEMQPWPLSDYHSRWAYLHSCDVELQAVDWHTQSLAASLNHSNAHACMFSPRYQTHFLMHDAPVRVPQQRNTRSPQSTSDTHGSNTRVVWSVERCGAVWEFRGEKKCERWCCGRQDLGAPRVAVE